VLLVTNAIRQPYGIAIAVYTTDIAKTLVIKAYVFFTVILDLAGTQNRATIAMKVGIIM
jgi:hypothetical protein